MKIINFSTFFSEIDFLGSKICTTHLLLISVSENCGAPLEGWPTKIKKIILFICTLLKEFVY